ncbi:hypothetical protein J4450_05345 [Candidatus Micrarchaeota archaeon]|nr:hypothetical protein [Candidatus Micrarchaeota archaeon]
MVSIKSLVLGVVSSLLFASAFIALFAFLVLANLPGEIDNLEKALSDNLPNIIVNSSAIKTKISSYMETSLFNGEDEQTMELMKLQCNMEITNVPDGLRSLCPDLLNGNINNKEDLKNALMRSFEVQLKEQINEGLKPTFSELKASISNFDQFKILILIISLALFFIAAMIVYFDSFNTAKTLNTVLWRISISSLSFVLPFLLFSILGLFGVNFENIMINSIQKNMKIEDSQAFIDQEAMDDILEPMVKLILDWFNAFFFKIIVIFAVIGIIGLVAWYLTRVRTQK